LIRSQLRGDKTRAERRDIKNDHDKREQIHPHGEANTDMHCTNADQPNLSCLARPNKKWISDFQQTNNNSCDREEMSPPYEDLRINDVERRANERAPHI